jgi:hypothetical protein
MVSYICKWDGEPADMVLGSVDIEVQAPSATHMLWNNTYGIQAINKTVRDAALAAYYSPGGCLELIQLCRNLSAIYDPDSTSANKTLSRLCQRADDCVNGAPEGSLFQSPQPPARANFDLLHPFADPFPPFFYVAYLNQHHIQRALGVPLNYTDFSPPVRAAFTATGDYIRAGALSDLSHLLGSGVRVAMVYGDRDYACNWIGGEALAAALEPPGFSTARYYPLRVNSTYIGGMTREYGALSFTRVFEAGHEVPAYQPEAAYRIFSRTIWGQPIAATAAQHLGAATKGWEDSWSIKNPIPPWPLPTCFVWVLRATCSEEQATAVVGGTAVIRDGIVIGYGNGTREGLEGLWTGGNGNYSGRAYFGEIEGGHTVRSRFKVRRWEAWSVAANVLGIGAAVGAWWWYRRIRNRRPWVEEKDTSDTVAGTTLQYPDPVPKSTDRT